MVAVTPETTLRAGFNWALWRLLDHLAAHVLPGTLFDRSRQAVEPHPLAPPPDSGASTMDALGSNLQAALSALKELAPGELEEALQSLNDDSSPLVQSLAWALGTPELADDERQRRLEASLRVLSKAEALAMLVVLMQQAYTSGAMTTH